MRFGVREIANVVFKAKSDQKIGSTTFVAGQPVLYIDSATASTLEGAATTVYAQGGRGNVRLVTWEGEKTLTFTVTDALLSPVGLAILSGAGLFKGGTTERVHVHMAHYASVTKTGTTGSEKYTIDINEYAGSDKVLADAPFFVLTAENGSIVGDVIKNVVVTSTETSSGSGKYTTTVEISTGGATYEGSQVFVDYYIEKSAAKVSELQIDAEHFAGNYYVEAETLFRRESDGVDMPAIITLPNVKIQSNFTFSMASTGDPSTFDFTMDALPGYTYFRKDKKVLCVIQIVEDASSADDFITSVMPHPASSVANGGGTGSTATGGNNVPKYFYETDKDGNIISAYNDINNDSIVDTNDYDEP